MATYKREPAYRVFAEELRNVETKLEKDPTDQYAPQYIVTPTGAKVNRVFMVGTITDIEDVGSDAPYWKVRIADPTGTLGVYAGEYQADAARALSQVAIPEILAITAKVHVYEPDDGGMIISLRPEIVAVVDQAAADRWILQTARQTLDRIRLLETQSPEALNDMKPYRQMIRAAFDGVQDT